MQIEDVLSLRTLAANHIRQHADEYLPFMLNDAGEMLSPGVCFSSGNHRACDDSPKLTGIKVVDIMDPLLPLVCATNDSCFCFCVKNCFESND